MQMIVMEMREHQRRTTMKLSSADPMLIRKRMAMAMHEVTKKKKTVMMVTIVQTRKEM
jgi:hypothetical protein